MNFTLSNLVKVGEVSQVNGLGQTEFRLGLVMSNKSCVGYCSC